MTKREFVKDIMGFFMKNKLFSCPGSNIIQEHNKKIFDLFKEYLAEDVIPVPEDLFLESSVITDFNDQTHNPDVILGDGLIEQITRLRKIKITDDIYIIK